MNETLNRRAADVRQWNEVLPGRILLSFVSTRDERSAVFHDFLYEFSSLASKVTVSETMGEPDGMPAIQFEDSWIFQMIPEEKELDPFLGLLSAVAEGNSSGLSYPVKEKLLEIRQPSPMEIFISTMCPNCHAVMERLTRLPLANPLIKVRAIDGTLFYEQARERSVRAVPTVFLADGQRFVGQVRTEDVVDGLVHGDPSRMSAEVFAGMIHAGDAEALAEMMVERGQVFPGVVELLAGEEFSLRLGAIVALEWVGEASPELALKALDELWPRVDGVSLTVRGDIVYLVGEFGDEAWISRLEGMLARESSPDLREAIEEALSNLRKRAENSADSP